MDRSFTKSILYSTLLHAALLLLLFLLYHSFVLIQPPLLMDLTLIGESSQGNGLGAPSAKTGQVPEQTLKSNNNDQIPSPQKDIQNPVPDNSQRPEVSMKKQKKKSQRNVPNEANLEKINNSEPIGMESQKTESTDIKTTEGVGHQAITGLPEGRPDIEGQLAARTIIRQVNPIYPDWAKKQGIEATVKFSITVLPSGLLRVDSIDLEQTSGYRELDRVVYDALIQWEFQALAPTVPQEDQSGVVTFSFSLKNDGQ